MTFIRRTFFAFMIIATLGLFFMPTAAPAPEPGMLDTAADTVDKVFDTVADVADKVFDTAADGFDKIF